MKYMLNPWLKINNSKKNKKRWVIRDYVNPRPLLLNQPVHKRTLLSNNLQMSGRKKYSFRLSKICTYFLGIIIFFNLFSFWIVFELILFKLSGFVSEASLLKLTALNGVKVLLLNFSEEGSLGEDNELLLLLPVEDVKLFVCTKKLDNIWISFDFSLLLVELVSIVNGSLLFRVSSLLGSVLPATTCSSFWKN